MKLSELKIAIVGLGYVGLPLAVAFGSVRRVKGFDTNQIRIDQLKKNKDTTLELNKEELKNARYLTFVSEISKLEDCNCFIVTVPSPIDKKMKPDLTFLKNACKMLGQIIKKDNIVIFESTVYPGCTEEDLVPILEKTSGLIYNKDFFCGYSPERINPGDKKHRISDIKKITSGSTSKVAKLIDQLYKQIITAGTYLAPSIKIAEAAKVIENIQRDVNIALINELAVVFSKLNIDTEEILKAAETKWNFISFRPGLVGGHCIGVDPYYLKYKAEKIGYYPKIIAAGRELNNAMGGYVAERVIKAITDKNMKLERSKVLVMGFTFKENCPDFRNTKVIDVIKTLEASHCTVDVYDPWVNIEDMSAEYSISMVKRLPKYAYDAVVITVAHKHFFDLGLKKIKDTLKPNGIIFDVKFLFPADDSIVRL